MEAVRSQTLPIKDLFDCAAAQLTARDLAQKAGFSESAVAEIVLTASELAKNIVKHAGHGTLRLGQIENGTKRGIELESLDAGPGIHDADQAFVDGYSTGGGLGYGLGTVNRLMDEVELDSIADQGTRLVCRKWLHDISLGPSSTRWDVGIATRSRRNDKANGDAFVIKKWQQKLLVAVIDGLGHGARAQEAAIAAQRYVNTHFEQDFSTMFAGVNRACAATRGVVMAAARFDSNTLAFASVGNVEVRARGTPERLPFKIQRGIIGAGDPKVVEQKFEWPARSLLVLHSDGCSNRWHWDDVPGIERESASGIAIKLLRGFSTADDDCTVLAVRGVAS